MSLRLLRYEDLAARHGIPYSRVHLARLEAKDAFPRRFYPTPGHCAWLESEIEAWLRERITNRDTLPCRSVPVRVIRGKAGA